MISLYTPLCICITCVVFGSTGPKGNKNVEIVGAVYLHPVFRLPGPAVVVRVSVCVLSFCSCYSCTRLQHCYISSTYTCLLPHSHIFYSLSCRNHSIFSHTLSQLGRDPTKKIALPVRLFITISQDGKKIICSGCLRNDFRRQSPSAAHQQPTSVKIWMSKNCEI